MAGRVSHRRRPAMHLGQPRPCSVRYPLLSFFIEDIHVAQDLPCYRRSRSHEPLQVPSQHPALHKEAERCRKTKGLSLCSFQRTTTVYTTKTTDRQKQKQRRRKKKESHVGKTQTTDDSRTETEEVLCPRGQPTWRSLALHGFSKTPSTNQLSHAGTWQHEIFPRVPW